MSNPVLVREESSWLASLVHGLSPLRWGVCILGLAGTVLLGVLLHIVRADGSVQGVRQWWSDPFGELAGLVWRGESLSGVLARVILLVAVFGPLWCWIGLWIIRREFEAQFCRRFHPRPWAMLRDRHRSAVAIVVFLYFMSLLVFIPGLIAGVVNRLLIFGIGAVFISLMLPVLLMLTCFCVLVLTGVFAIPLGPAALAAEGNDGFDGLSRMFAYSYQGLLPFLLGLSLILLVSSSPLLMVGWLIGNVDAVARFEPRPLLWTIAGGLSLSWFWTLHAPFYLKLRRLIDGEPECEIHDEEEGDFAQLYRRRPPRDNTSAATLLDQEPPQDIQDEGGIAADGKLPEPTPEDLRLPYPRPSLEDTFSVGNVWLGDLSRLFAGVLANLLLFLLAREIFWRVAGTPGTGALADRFPGWAVVWERHPLLFLLLPGVWLAGAWVLNGPVHRVARSVIVTRVSGLRPSSEAVAEWSRQYPDRPLAGAFFLASGLHAMFITEQLLLRACKGDASWRTALYPGGAGILLMCVAAHLVVASVFRGCSQFGGERGEGFSVPSPFGCLAGALRMLIVVFVAMGLLAVSWVVLRDGIIHLGGMHTHWIDVGPYGLSPDVEPGLYLLASLITLGWAGVLFVLLQGLPVCSLLHSATLMWLWNARSSTSERRLVITVQEYQSIQEQRMRGR